MSEEIKQKKIMLSEMTSKEVDNAVKISNIVLIPIGTVEQHGAHLPLFTDNIIADEVTKRAAEKISCEFPSYQGGERE